MNCDKCKYRGSAVCKPCRQEQEQAQREKMVYPYMRKSYRTELGGVVKVQMVSMR